MTLIFDATNAYLGPLLEKHTAGQPLVWEDLVASQAACNAVLRQSNNIFLSVSWRINISSWNYYRNWEDSEGKREEENEEKEEFETEPISIDRRREEQFFLPLSDGYCRVTGFSLDENVKRRAISNVPLHWPWRCLVLNKGKGSTAAWLSEHVLVKDTLPKEPNKLQLMVMMFKVFPW